MTADLTQWVALSLIPNVGGRTLATLLDHFDTLDAILAANESELRAVRGIGPKLAAAILAVDVDHTAAEIAAWQADGIAILRPTPGCATYPAALAALPDAPPVLFQRGGLVTSDARAVAIVGTRHPAPADYDLASTIAFELAQLGWTIVSGLATGIDAAAHWGALRAGGRTVAVLGSGINVIYPPQNADLAALISAKNSTRCALFSEIHPESPPNSPALVARNRLISGLSHAIIVVAAGTTSGSLHAARFARAQGRLVYAVDTDLDGNRRLLADGARPLPPDFAAWDTLSNEIAEM